MMKEITRIITVRITAVGKVHDESKVVSREVIEEYLKRHLENDFECDDVQVLDVQNFILDPVDDEEV